MSEREWLPKIHMTTCNIHDVQTYNAALQILLTDTLLIVTYAIALAATENLMPRKIKD